MEFVALLTIASGIVLIFFVKASEWLNKSRTFLQSHSENQYHTLAICLQVAHNHALNDAQTAEEKTMQNVKTELMRST